MSSSIFNIPSPVSNTAAQQPTTLGGGGSVHSSLFGPSTPASSGTAGGFHFASTSTSNNMSLFAPGSSSSSGTLPNSPSSRAASGPLLLDSSSQKGPTPPTGGLIYDPSLDPPGVVAKHFGRSTSAAYVIGIEFVEIKYGDSGEKRTMIHKALAKVRAEYFARGSHFKSSTQQPEPFDFTHFNPHAVEIFVRWMYTSILPRSIFTTQLPESWLGLYQLAHELHIIQLMDLTLEVIDTYFQQNPTLSLLQTFYRDTFSDRVPVDSKLELWVVHHISYRALHDAGSGLDPSSSSLSDDLSKLVMHQIWQDNCARKSRETRLQEIKANRCSYHHHDKAKPCPYRGTHF